MVENTFQSLARICGSKYNRGIISLASAQIMFGQFILKDIYTVDEVIGDFREGIEILEIPFNLTDVNFESGPFTTHFFFLQKGFGNMILARSNSQKKFSPMMQFDEDPSKEGLIGIVTAPLGLEFHINVLGSTDPGSVSNANIEIHIV